MLRRILTLLCFVQWVAQPITAEDMISITQNNVSLRVASENGKLVLTVLNGTTIKLKGEIGVQTSGQFSQCVDMQNCIVVGDMRLHINTHVDYGFTIFWTSKTKTTVFEDCFELGSFHWFGGPERFEQVWPIEKLTLSNFANVLQEDKWGAVVEPYWLNSEGVYILVNDKVPLFINQNTDSSQKKVCFSAKIAPPYSPSRQRVILHYTIGIQRNAREAHLHAVKNFLGKPTGHPNYKIIERPIWSTWAKYKRDVNDDVVRKFAKEIADNGYSNGQFEIDDDWEDCYGALTFRKSKFSKISETVNIVKSYNFTVSLWVHPFINTNCTKYLNLARTYGFLVKDANNNDLTKWWNSGDNEATYLDFTNIEVQEWFVERLKALQKAHGIDSFKFDAGETTWAPTISQLYGDVETMPNVLSSDYVRTCAQLGDLVEVRSAWKTQDLPIFVRMIDKDSNWGVNNGLYTLITTLLQMNINGYPLVLPDMIGGNGYQGKPSAELFVRWLQANTFMPSIQFSYVPWEFTDAKFNVSEISRKFVDLHQKYAPYIKSQMEKSVKEGGPVNAPIWWISPNDTKALPVDTEFLLGDDILVAPIIIEGATSRDIYLPAGEWVDGNNGSHYQGPIELKNYTAPIDVLPYFLKGQFATGGVRLFGVPLILIIITVTIIGVVV
ncbi:hypothetical protein RI129_007726 [Pyrocoelia pectoralis]|uniref:Alpha-glucosidase n=1 Tax=Pyrocoelia pectoralis TaxID=417401 RepID=A0AAN7ZN20_9COLE